MNTFALWLAHRLARTLEPRERDALLGDQKELGLTGARAAREALGLVVRRQYQLSTADESGLGPWWRLAPLFYILISQSLKITRWLDASFFPSFFFFYACWGAIVVVLSWTTGFLLGSVSGRARRVNSALLAGFWLVYLGCSSASYQFSTAPLMLHGLLFVLPVAAGFRNGAVRESLSTFKAVVIAAVPPSIFLGLVILVSQGESSGGSPVFFIVFLGFVLIAFIGTILPGGLLIILSLLPPRVDPPPSPEAAP